MANHTNQIHDFNPGFGEPVNAAGDRTFWTIAIPDQDVRIPKGQGKAGMRVQDLEVEDYFNLGNALADGPSVDATVSFEVRWTPPVTRKVHVADPATEFDGTFLETHATVTWSASEDGFTFVSDPAPTSIQLFAETGRERNGVFFSASSSSAIRAHQPAGSEAAAGPTRLDAAALVHALGSGAPAPVVAPSTPLAPSAAMKPAATLAGNSQAAQSGLAASHLRAGAAISRAVDHVFLDLGSGGSLHAFGTEPLTPVL